MQGAQFAVEVEKLICTCGIHFHTHKSGRCIDAILYRLAYGQEPQIRDAGAPYVDGIRDLALFSEDLLVEENGETHLVPYYSSDPGDAMILFSKWYDMGGTGHINMNRSGWSASFSHGIARRTYYHAHLIRTRLEWLPARALAQRLIELRRTSGSDDCTWIDGVDPIPDAQS